LVLDLWANSISLGWLWDNATVDIIGLLLTQWALCIIWPPLLWDANLSLGLSLYFPNPKLWHSGALLLGLGNPFSALGFLDKITMDDSGPWPCLGPIGLGLSQIILGPSLAFHSFLLLGYPSRLGDPWTLLPLDLLISLALLFGPTWTFWICGLAPPLTNFVGHYPWIMDTFDVYWLLFSFLSWLSSYGCLSLTGTMGSPVLALAHLAPCAAGLIWSFHCLLPSLWPGNKHGWPWLSRLSLALIPASSFIIGPPPSISLPLG